MLDVLLAQDDGVTGNMMMYVRRDALEQIGRRIMIPVTMTICTNNGRHICMLLIDTRVFCMLKLQVLVYDDIRPPTAAITDDATGLR